MGLIKGILQFIGLLTVIWLVSIGYQEYMNIRKEEREKDGQSQ